MKLVSRPADPSCWHCGGTGIEMDCGGYENQCDCAVMLVDSPSYEVLTRSEPKDRPCPTCGAVNVLSAADVDKGYQCAACVAAGKGW